MINRVDKGQRSSQACMTIRFELANTLNVGVIDALPFTRHPWRFRVAIRQFAHCTFPDHALA